MATKSFFNGSFAPGDVITEPIAGLFRFRLVHNTGAAWGMFGDSTFALGIMSIVVCVLLLAYLVVGAKHMNMGQIVGLAVVFAGGVGNAIDRFTLGYVVDFIDFTFIDFPVFNVADIGVTCGFVIFIASMLYAWRKDDAQAAESGDAASESVADGFFDDPVVEEVAVSDPAAERNPNQAESDAGVEVVASAPSEANGPR